MKRRDFIRGLLASTAIAAVPLPAAAPRALATGSFEAELSFGSFAALDQALKAAWDGYKLSPDRVFVSPEMYGRLASLPADELAELGLEFDGFIELSRDGIVRRDAAGDELVEHAMLVGEPPFVSPGFRGVL